MRPDLKMEYELWNTRERKMVKSFSPWPKWELVEEGVPPIFTYSCWRLYTTDGYLIKEIHLEKAENRGKSDRSVKRAVYYDSNPVTDEKRIYILSTSDERNPRSCLEVWTWEGEPVACYQLDRELNHFVIEGNVLYGVDNGNIYEDEVMKILEYNLPALY